MPPEWHLLILDSGMIGLEPKSRQFHIKTEWLVNREEREKVALEAVELVEQWLVASKQEGSRSPPQCWFQLKCQWLKFSQLHFTPTISKTMNCNFSFFAFPSLISLDNNLEPTFSNVFGEAFTPLNQNN